MNFSYFILLSLLILFSLGTAEPVYRELHFTDQPSCEANDESQYLGSVSFPLGKCMEEMVKGDDPDLTCEEVEENCLSKNLDFETFQNCTGLTDPNPTFRRHHIFFRNGTDFYRQTFVNGNSSCNGLDGGTIRLNYGLDNTCQAWAYSCSKRRSITAPVINVQQYKNSTISCQIPENTTFSTQLVQESCYPLRNVTQTLDCAQIESCMQGQELNTYHSCLEANFTVEGSFKVWSNNSHHMKAVYSSLNCSGVPVVSVLNDICQTAQMDLLGHSEQCSFTRTQFSPSFLVDPSASLSTTVGAEGADSDSDKIGIILGGTLGGAVLLATTLAGVLILCLCCFVCLMAIVVIAGVVVFSLMAAVGSTSVMAVKMIKIKRDDTVSGVELGQKLGSGSFGTVWKATDENGEQIAIKRIFLDTDTDKEELLAEVAILEKVGRSFPYLVQFKGMIIDDNQHLGFIKMELCDSSMESHLKNYETSLDEKFAIIAKVASALALMHSQGVVHRDLSLRNILMKDGQPKVSDFGLSRMISDEYSDAGQTVTRTIPIRWTAPEAARVNQGQVKFSTTSDIFSLGMTMVEILTGDIPFKNLGAIEAGKAIRNGEIPKLPQELPEEFLKIYRQCLSFEPSQRPKAGEVATALRALTSISLGDMGEYVSFEEDPNYVSAENL